MLSQLNVTDGNDELIDLLRNFFCIKSFTNAAATPKSEIIQSSPFMPESQLIHSVPGNITDTFTFDIVGDTQDDVIEAVQDLRRLLNKGVEYWTAKWQNTPVYIEAQADCETNIRYALIKNFRMPNLSNPYFQPFESTAGEIIIEDLPVVIEHGLWLSQIPGEAECIEAAEGGLRTSYHNFNGTTTRVDCGSDASINDLPDGVNGFTAEGWVRFDSTGESTSPRIFDKRDLSADGWRIFMDTSGVVATGNVIVANAQFGGAPGNSALAFAKYPEDSEWHHVAAVLEPVGLDWTWFIDGVLAPNISDQSGAGAYDVDGAEDLYIGNRANVDRTWDGSIGWCRLSDNLRYTTRFTPQARCAPPRIDANTIAQWHFWEGEGTNLIEYGSNMNDGTIADGDWPLPDCQYVREAICDQEIFIANKQNNAQIEYIFLDDGGAIGDNLKWAALPFNLLPAVPVAGDIIYFGSTQGPFCSLVLDLIAGSDFTGVWEYGIVAGWTTFALNNIVDYTLGFLASNVKSVHWEQNHEVANFAPRAVNGVTAYWVRFRITAVNGGAEVGTQQQNREVYTITWNSSFYDGDNVGGDVPAKIRHILLARNEIKNSGLPTNMTPTYLLLGLRSASRGINFTPYLNFSDEQNIPGISSGNFFPVGNINSPTGRAERAVFGGAGDLEVGRIIIDSTINKQFDGTFRIFIRCDQTSGVAGDLELRLEVWNTETNIITQGYRVLPHDGINALLDLGIYTFPIDKAAPTNHSDDVFDSLFLQVRGNAAAALIVEAFDLFLLPIDEWAGTFNRRGTGDLLNDVQLDIDSVRNPKTPIRALYRPEDLATITTTYLYRTNGSIILQANRDQRLWSLGYTDFSGDIYSYPEFAFAVKTEGVQQYSSMRGSR